jgi:hypothetical protein
MPVKIAGDIAADGTYLEHRTAATTAPFPYRVQVPGTVDGEAKTVTYPELASGTASDNLTSRLSSDTGASGLQNKDLFDSTVRFVGAADQTKILDFDVDNLGAASTTTLQLAAISASRTYTLPALTGNDTFLTEAHQATVTNKQLDSGVTFVAGGTFDLSAPGSVSLFTNAGANNITLGQSTSTVVVAGNLQVDGTTTTVNSTTLEVTDPNITINDGGNDASADGSGLTIERTGTDGSLVYEDALASKFKAGPVGSEIELVNLSATQTLTNKNINAASNNISNLSHGVHVDNPTSGVHGVTGNVVGTSDTQTLTNKTLTSPVISSIVNIGTLTLPTATDTLVGRSTTDTLANKSFQDATCNFVDEGDASKVLSVSLGGGTTSTSTTLSFAQTVNRVWTFQDATDTVVGRATTDTLTSKSIDSDNNTITNIVDADIKAAAGIALNKLAATPVDRALISDSSGFVSASATTSDQIGYLSNLLAALSTEGDIFYHNGTGVTRLARGTTDQVLQATASTIGWATLATGGDVSAAAVMVDHRLIRGDGGAKGIQDSGITVDDSDNITGVGSLTATSFVGPGSVPLGSIIAIASNLTGAMAIPSTGTVDSNGFQYCDGAAINAGATMSGTIYNLTDERFLVGSTTAGTTGGSNTLIDHTHTDTLALSDGTLNSGSAASAGTHTHDTIANHTHTFNGSTTSTVSAGSHTHTVPAISNTQPQHNFAGGGEAGLDHPVVNSGPTGSDGAHTHDFTPVGANVANGGHTHTSTGTAHTHTVTGSVGTALSGSVGSGAAPSSTNSRPLYLSVQYVMRVS